MKSFAKVFCLVIIAVAMLALGLALQGNAASTGDKLVSVGGGKATYDVYDEDTMSSDSAGGVPTQQSVKAYHDNNENIFSVSVHAFDGNATWTLSTAEAKSLFLVGQNATSAVDIVAPAVNGQTYILRNEDDSSAMTLKVSGQTGISVAAARTAMVRCNGTDYVRVTADQTH